jgi:hypothetical protein
MLLAFASCQLPVDGGSVHCWDLCPAAYALINFASTAANVAAQPLLLLLQVVSSLQELYDRQKGSYGWQDRPLSIE